MVDFDSYFQTASVPGSLFFHQPHEVRIESFDEKSPFKPSYTWLVSQPVPSGSQNRRRFVHGLATLDAQVMVNGGWLLPMGQEESLRGLVAAYRSLPPIRFQPVVGGPQSDASQPVTFRVGEHGGRTYLYAVNNAPFSTTARIHVEASPSCRIEEISGTRKVAPLQSDGGKGQYWEVRLDPYDLRPCGCRSRTCGSPIRGPPGPRRWKRRSGRRFAGSAPGLARLATRNRWTCWPIRALRVRPRRRADPRLGRQRA